MSIIKSRIYTQVSTLIGFNELGFSEHEREEGYHTLHKSVGDAILTLGFRYFPDPEMESNINETVNLTGVITYNIIFPRLNKILDDVFSAGEYLDNSGERMKSIYLGATVVESNDLYVLQNSARRAQNFLPFIENGILYPERLEKICGFHKQHIEQYALPFFNKYDTMNKVNNELISKMPWEDLSKRIPTHTPFMRLLIMKICNNTEYDTFFRMFTNRLTDAVKQGMTQYKSYCEAFIALHDRLNEIEPNEN